MEPSKTQLKCYAQVCEAIMAATDLTGDRDKLSEILNQDGKCYLLKTPGDIAELTLERDERLNEHTDWSY